MFDTRTKHELLELLGALCNEALEEDQHARLSRLLQEHADARDIYYRYLEIHLRLSQWSGVEGHTQPLMVLKRELQRILPEKVGASGGRDRSWWSFPAVIAATVLLTVGLQQWVTSVTSEDPSDGVVAGVAAESLQGDSLSVGGVPYVATLARSADCVWDEVGRPCFDGQRLLSRELRLKTGIAEFRFETGVRLVVEGPASLTIESDRSATMRKGRVVLHGDEMSVEFALRTPHATLIDIGTEYGVFVGPSDVTEVHVFKGEVRVEPHDANSGRARPQTILGGGASRLDANGSTDVPLTEEKFIREIPASALPRISSAHDLLALEEFAYPGPNLGNADGGIGWAGPWREGIEDFRAANATIVPDEDLVTAAGKQGETTGHALQSRIGFSCRTMATPVRMDIDAVYYLSFLLNKSRGSPPGTTQYGSVSLRHGDLKEFSNKRVVFGMSSENYVILTHNSQQILTAPRLFTGETYSYVAKIVAGQSDPDQVMLRVYGAGERVDSSEPSIWNCISRPFEDDTVYSELFIFVGGDADFHVDQIRIGSTWDTVTAGM